ncbi:MAG: hypothetical protein A2Y33_04195 [Spirochaetes bacterium GWF1_51_8]|nr:MAG: hypothetical protein A2Y33_04195 [Spirochaetes bacterium GWF1_51_8]
MKRKEILRLVQEMGQIELIKLQQIFGADNRSKRKRLKIVLVEFAEKGMIALSGDPCMVSWSGGSEKIADDAPEEQTAVREKKKPLGAKPLAKPINVRNPETDLDRMVEKYNLRRDFPAAVLQEANDIPKIAAPEEVARRVDMRSRLVVTIDGIDAKDLDDAVSLEVRIGPDGKIEGWNLGVHIADVSHYVPLGTKLDKEALKRGNSYYFVNKVLPMFPEALSNHLCSLNPREDKLTVSAFMELSADGHVKSYEIKESIICTRHRLNYTDVQRYFDGELKLEDAELAETLDKMRELYRLLYENRIKSGSIDFDFQEQKISLNETGEPEKVWLKDRLDSERIIEEFMLLANKVVARYLADKGHSIFRIHEEPTTEKIADFVRLALRFGHKLYGVPVPTPVEIQKVLFEIKDKPYKEFLSQLLLRSMMQARYDTENLGHYGLGFEYYTHFTSPIRRYADLIVHRLIKEALAGQKSDTYDSDRLNEISRHISTTERVAMDAEREFFKIKAVRFMKDKEGKVYDGMITGVTAFGMFVQITEFGIEGLVRYMDIDDDYYIADEKEYTAHGRDHRQRYTIGDKVKIKVKRVNIERGFLDFTIYFPDVPRNYDGIKTKVNRGSIARKSPSAGKGSFFKKNRSKEK